MYHQAKRIALTAALVLAFPAMVSADATAIARQTITSVYNKIDSAAEHKDVNGATRYDAPSFVQIVNGRKMTRADRRMVTTQMVATAASLVCTSNVKKFQLHGNEAVATVERKQVYVRKPTPQDKNKTKFTFDTVSNDTWKKTPKGWMRFSSKSLAARVSRG